MKFVKAASFFESAMKTKIEAVAREGRLLGLDVGDRYVGISVSDPPNKIAHPLSVLVRSKSTMDLMAADLLILISKLSISGFVIGYPFKSINSYDRWSDGMHVDFFIDELKESGKFEDFMYTYWNERYTTKAIQFMLQPLSFHPLDYKMIKDKFAAVGILQGYLDFMNKVRS